VIFNLRKGYYDPSTEEVSLMTEHPLAFNSPDHLQPWGTANDNSTNRRFVMYMDGYIWGRRPTNSDGPYRMLDLGCAGGQLVKDFKDMGWTAVGLEGSDYSLKKGRANWPALGNKNLFTCDITRPFRLFVDVNPARFDLITAWEVLEHIHPYDVKWVLENIYEHLKPGGLFIASTTNASDVHDGVELHQSWFTNEQWRNMIEKFCPELRPIELGLQYYEYVRFNYKERSFLTYQRKV